VSGLFLPFAAKAKVIELKAIKLKKSHAYGPYDAVDPDELALRMGVAIIPDAWFETLDPDLRRQLLEECEKDWSAGSLPVKGQVHVLLNPGHTAARRSSSLAEELMHVGLGHPASTLLTVDGVPIRTCRQDVESEAYAVAIATLLPYPTVFNHLNDGGAIDDIPALVPVSPDARRYRVKVAGLWRLAQARARSKLS
jgi:uncharacterized protein DUF955